MPSYLQIDNISKSYGTKVLFDHIGFNINEGDKIALVAPNGTGKTSLLRILAGKDNSDSGGSIKFLRDVRIAFLEQEYDYDPQLTVGQQLATDDFDTAKKIIDKLQGVSPVTDQLKSPVVNEAEKDWTFDDYHKSGKLENLKKTNPERFAALFEAKYGHKPNI